MQRSWKRAGAVVLGMMLSWAAAGQEKPTCGNVKVGELFKNPKEIHAKDGVLSTTLDVQKKWFCIPTDGQTDPQGNPIGVWRTTPMELRTYVYTDPQTGELTHGLPGPTLRLRKAALPGGKGDSLEILLKNNLPVSSDPLCNSACPDNVSPKCQIKPDGTCEGDYVDRLRKDCASGKATNCCCLINCTQEPPNCFHGDNTTNLHFHGTHVSPQEPQDFVLLQLRPGKKPANADVHGHEGNPYEKIVYGEFQYRVAPFGFTQSEGTHWYHPHKHGSVGLQVANGMAGALIIAGPFDDELKKFYDDPDDHEGKGEKIFVIQQIAEGTNLFGKNVPTTTLVNGQLSPTIWSYPGKIERWRFINATMSSMALLEIRFPQSMTVRQIAMDGITFSDVNFKCQPLANFNPTKPPATFPCDGKFEKLTLAPGNRADFLVWTPPWYTTKGQPPLRIERRIIDLGEDEKSLRRLLRQRDEAAAPGIPEPALFQVVVDDGIPGNEDKPKSLAEMPGLPSSLPEYTNPYLKNIAADDVKGDEVKMTFQQFVAGTNQLWPYSGSPLSQFKIENRQYQGNCANVTTKVGTVAKWTVSNATLLPHPFHIHTNPFQLIDYNGASLPPPGKKEPEPIWMDTMPLPLASSVKPPDAPKDLAAPIWVTPATMTFWQRYEQFTGPYVLHCHFLGHEDRGMMFNVQTVCKDKPEFYGKAGPGEECRPDNLIPAVKECTKLPATPAAGGQ